MLQMFFQSFTRARVRVRVRVRERNYKGSGKHLELLLHLQTGLQSGFPAADVLQKSFSTSAGGGARG